MRLSIKRFICFAMVSRLMISNSTSLFATESKACEKLDYEAIADLVSERYYLDEELAKIGLNLDDIFALPKMDESFYKKAEALTADALPTSASTEDEKTKQITEAKRLAYAGKMAQWSVAQKPSRNEQQEVVYMYLSHYIDVPSPLSESNGISTNSEGNVLAKYICQYDRDTYDMYLAKGNTIQAAQDIKNLLTFAQSAPSSITDAITWSKSKSYLLKSSSVIQANMTFSDGMEAFKIIENGMNNGESPASVINNVQNSLIFYGDLAEAMAIEFVGIVFSIATSSTTPIGLGIVAASIAVDLSTTIFNQANFVSMRMYFNFRWSDRFDYWMYGNMS